LLGEHDTRLWRIVEHYVWRALRTAEAIGADAYCRDAAVAVETAKSLLARRQGTMQAREQV
jgi:hypothetical protein